MSKKESRIGLYKTVCKLVGITPKPDCKGYFNRKELLELIHALKENKQTTNN